MISPVCQAGEAFASPRGAGQHFDPKDANIVFKCFAVGKYLGVLEQKIKELGRRTVALITHALEQSLAPERRSLGIRRFVESVGKENKKVVRVKRPPARREDRIAKQAERRALGAGAGQKRSHLAGPSIAEQRTRVSGIGITEFLLPKIGDQVKRSRENGAILVAENGPHPVIQLR